MIYLRRQTTLKQNLFRNEQGSLSIEFIGLLPFVIILFLIIWQLIGTGTSLLMAQKAVNESAKVYSITKDTSDAERAVRNIIGSNSSMNYTNFSVQYEGDKYFNVKFDANYKIVFLPERWRKTFTIPHKSYSRVLE